MASGWLVRHRERGRGLPAGILPSRLHDRGRHRDDGRPRIGRLDEVEDQIPGDTDRHRIRERPGLTDGEARDFHDETVHGWASPELLRNFRTAMVFLPEVCGSTKLIIR